MLFRTWSRLFFAYHTEADVGISDRRFACFVLLFRSATGSEGFPRTSFDRFGVILSVCGSPLPNIAPHVNCTTSRECFWICVDRCCSIIFSTVEIRIFGHVSGSELPFDFCRETVSGVAYEFGMCVEEFLRWFNPLAAGDKMDQIFTSNLLFWAAIFKLESLRTCLISDMPSCFLKRAGTLILK